MWGIFGQLSLTILRFYWSQHCIDIFNLPWVFMRGFTVTGIFVFLIFLSIILFELIQNQLKKSSISS